jgi:hypothetical protein
MKLWRTVRAMLREIFDETAFERYCAREGVARSREAYAEFLRESKAPRVRCC